MRIVIILLALSVGLGWFGYAARAKDRALSNVLLFFSALFALALIGAVFEFV